MDEEKNPIAKSMREPIAQFSTQLRRREIRSSYHVAKKTAELLRAMLSSAKIKLVREGIELVHRVGNMLQSAQPTELTVGNIVRRVLYFLREEYVGAKQAGMKEFYIQKTMNQDILHRSLDKLFIDGAEDDTSYDDSDISWAKIKSRVMSDIAELLDELDTVYSLIIQQATQHIHSNEIIMTFGHSTTVLEFLKAAGRKIKFHVIVAEAAPSYQGHDAALELSKNGIDTTLISDSAIFAMMSRVNKVIVGTQFVLANGGLVALSGTRMLLEAAKNYSVPVMVCVGLYKLCPIYPQDQESFNDLTSPSEILTFEEVDKLSQGRSEAVNVENATFDYVPPHLTSLFVTNYGGHNPSYIYRLLQEYYHPSDYSFSDEIFL